MLPNASGIEVLEVLVGIFGTLYNASNFILALRGVRWLEDHHQNGARLFWASARVRQELLLLMVQILWLTIAIASLFLPPPGPPDIPFTLQGQLRNDGIIVGQILVAVYSWMYRYDRSVLATTEWEGVDRRGDVPSLHHLPPRS